MEEFNIKEKIQKGAEELFMRYGVRSISMDDIARHLTVSKKTLYQHFADKEDIVTVTCKAHLDRNAEEFQVIRKTAKNAIEELVQLSVCLKRNMQDMNPSLLFDLQKYHLGPLGKDAHFRRCDQRNVLDLCDRVVLGRSVRHDQMIGGGVEGHQRHFLQLDIFGVPTDSTRQSP